MNRRLPPARANNHTQTLIRPDSDFSIAAAVDLLNARKLASSRRADQTAAAADRHGWRPADSWAELKAEEGARPSRSAADDLLDHPPVHVGQAEVSPRVAVRQPLVVQPHQVQDGRVQVVDVYLVLDRPEAELVRRPVR